MRRYNWPDGRPIGSSADQPGSSERELPCPTRSTRRSERWIADGVARREHAAADDARARGRARHQSRHGPGGLPPARRTSGLVAGRVGSGTVVLGPSAPRGARFGWKTWSRAGSRPPGGDRPPRSPPPLVADFSRLAPDERFFPLEEFTRTLSVRLEPAPGPLAVRSPARPRGAARRDLPPARARTASSALPTRSWSSAARSRASTCSSAPSPIPDDVVAVESPDVLRGADAGAAGRRLGAGPADGRRAARIRGRSRRAAPSSST